MNDEEIDIFSQLCEIIDESEQMSIEVMNHLDIVLEKLDNKDIKGAMNNIMTIMSSMQAQDFHRQKIERVANIINPENTKFARAKHIAGDKNNDLVDEDELASLINGFRK